MSPNLGENAAVASDPSKIEFRGDKNQRNFDGSQSISLDLVDRHGRRALDSQNAKPA